MMLNVGLPSAPCIYAGVAGQLNTLGVTGYFADAVGQQLSGANLGWKPVFGLLSVVYYALHYMFASQTAHVGALYSAFLAMMLSSGVPTGPPVVPLASCGLTSSSQGMCGGVPPSDKCLPLDRCRGLVSELDVQVESSSPCNVATRLIKLISSSGSLQSEMQPGLAGQ